MAGLLYTIIINLHTKINVILLCQYIQKQLVSIIEGLCKGHGCLKRTEIITLTAILKSANVLKDTGSAPSDQQKDISLSQGDDFFQRLQTAFTETGDGSSSFAKDKTRYFVFQKNYLLIHDVHCTRKNVEE